MSSRSHRRGKIVKRSYTDEMRLAALRASGVESGATFNDDDTDSVASSVSSFSELRSTPRRKGVSPLNRRRSLRLAIKNAMDTSAAGAPQTALLKQPTYRTNSLFRSLVGQNTVEMNTPPPPLERMETSTRWKSYRNKKSILSGQDTIGGKKRIVQRMDTSGDLPPPIKRKRTVQWNESAATNTGANPQSILLKKKSTTWGLRQMLGNTGLDEAPVQAAAESAAGVLDVEHRATLKRKATALKSPPIQADPPRKSALTRTRSSVRKRVTILSPLEEDCTDGPQPGPSHVFAGQMKRQVTLGADGYGGAGPQTKRRKSSIERQQSQAGVQGVYNPPQAVWPVQLPAQVVWTVPLTGTLGGPINGYAVHVDSAKCLIGDEEGKIVELNESVVPTRVYELTAGIKCIVQDAEFTYVGCDDGGLYDLSAGEPRLVSHCRGFGRVYAMDVFQGLMAASDHHGNVVLINQHGVAWKRKSDGEFGWMVQVDDTGVYHGHSTGVTKYSLLDGNPVWHVNTEESVLHGVQKPGAIYVAAGPKIFKLDTITGAILQIYNKGKSHTRTLHSNAVGAGLVFAGGNKIVVYDEISGDVVYVVTHTFKPASMRYFSGRLFCIGQGAMSVLDFTENTINNAQVGVNLQTVEVTPDPAAPHYTPLAALNAVSAAQAHKHGVVIECVRPAARKGRLLARTLSLKYNNTWDIQVPEGLCQEGQKLVVQDLKPSDSGNFYRIFGAIQAVQ